MQEEGLMPKIKPVTQYYEWFVSDCFTNSIANVIIQAGLDVNVVLCDYFSFFYNYSTHSIGANYPLDFNIPVYLDEKWQEFINNSYKYLKFWPVIDIDDSYCFSKARDSGKINIHRYTSSSGKTAWNRTKQILDSGNMAVCAVDIYYMKYHRYYMKEHAIHYVNVTGYDEENNLVEIFDRYKTTGSDFEGEIDLEEFILARQSENPLELSYEGITGIAINNLWVEVNIPKDFSVEEEGRLAILKKSSAIMKGQGTDKTYLYGIPGFERFISDIEKIDQIDVDIRFYFVYHFRSACKNLQRNRARFSNFIENSRVISDEKLKRAVLKDLMLSSELWGMLSNIVYKYGVKQKEETFVNIIKNLKEIKAIEMRVSNSLY